MKPRKATQGQVVLRAWSMSSSVTVEDFGDTVFEMSPGLEAGVLESLRFNGKSVDDCLRGYAELWLGESMIFSGPTFAGRVILTRPILLDVSSSLKWKVFAPCRTWLPCYGKKPAPEMREFVISAGGFY
jgi:hypothetical protein